MQRIGDSCYISMLHSFLMTQFVKWYKVAQLAHTEEVTFMQKIKLDVVLTFNFFQRRCGHKSGHMNVTVDLPYSVLPKAKGSSK